MTGLDVALILLAVATIAGSVALVLYVRRPRVPHGDLVGERVVLQTKDDRSLRGVLTGVYQDCLVVSHFEYLHEAQVTGLPGEATVRFDNLSWIHKLGAGD